MAKYTLCLTPSQRAELNRLSFATSNPKTLRIRLEIIRLTDFGQDVETICRELGVNQATVRRAIKAFKTEGFEGLKYKGKPKGRPLKLRPEHIKALIQQDFATSAEGLAWLEENYGITVSAITLKRRLTALLRAYEH